MKIECDKCSAKYSIADEKVRGKTFKIRCKKCSNVIIVRDKASADGVALGGDDGGAAAGWHLAINGETVGPMGEDDVRQRFRAGEIDRDTAVWQEGFEDWVPLGDVDTFADLASSSGHAAADPFASANQEDYAAAQAQAQAQMQAQSRGAAVSAAPVAAQPVARAAGGMAVAEPSSPRVTRLTGQRNENSVLFSLDSLQALATGGGGGPARAGGGGPAPSRSGPRGLATVAPSSEGSGLIDIRALGAMVGSDAAPAHSAPTSKSVDDATLPSFGGANLGGLASTPLTPQVAAVDHHHMAGGAQPQRSNAPLYVLMVLLLLGIVGLGAFVFLRKPEQVIVEKTVPGEPAPSVKGGGADDDDDDDKDKDKDKDKDEDGEDAKDEDAKDEGEAAEGEAKDTADDKGADEGGSKTTAKKPSGSSGSSKPSGSSGSSKPSTPTTPKPTPAPSSSGSLDVDCILDPNLPKCKGGGTSKPGTPKPTPAPSDPSLPDTLTTNDIKAGVEPVKAAAKSCSGKHGASPGEKVKVKLSIAGATGNVTSASAEPPHQGTPLGNCVAAALKKAHFKKFKKPSLGAVYPVSM